MRSFLFFQHIGLKERLNSCQVYLLEYAPLPLNTGTPLQTLTCQSSATSGVLFDKPHHFRYETPLPLTPIPPSPYPHLNFHTHRFLHTRRPFHLWHITSKYWPSLGPSNFEWNRLLAPFLTPPPNSQPPKPPRTPPQPKLCCPFPPPIVRLTGLDFGMRLKRCLLFVISSSSIIICIKV